MKIADVEIIPFHVPRQLYHNGQVWPETPGVQTLTRLVTDEGAEGYFLGGQGHGDADGLLPEDRAAVQGRVRSFSGTRSRGRPCRGGRRTSSRISPSAARCASASATGWC